MGNFSNFSNQSQKLNDFKKKRQGSCPIVADDGHDDLNETMFARVNTSIEGCALPRLATDSGCLSNSRLGCERESFKGPIIG